MNGNGSYGTTWADQWDEGPDPVYGDYENNNNKNKSKKTIISSKVGEGLGKTKAVATTGVKKVKEGTVSGFNWIKHKYHHRTSSSSSK
ncbi:hypothetical protein M5689_017247 [Euphorbia peplus]|nr:hypothetical protein M5689_017247 [Euphorbia peplus]